MAIATVISIIPAIVPKTKYEQVQHRPGWLPNRRQNEQRDGRRSCQAMKDPHGQGAQQMKETQLAKELGHSSPCGCCALFAAAASGTIRSQMNVNPVIMNMRMRNDGIPGRSKCLRNPAHESRQIQNTQKDQHEADRQLHGKADPG